MAIPIPGEVRELFNAPNYAHLATLRADGSPRNWVVWAGLEGDHILVCTSDAIWKAKDMRRDPPRRTVSHRHGQPVPDGRDPGTGGGSTPRRTLPVVQYRFGPCRTVGGLMPQPGRGWRGACVPGAVYAVWA